MGEVIKKQGRFYLRYYDEAGTRRMRACDASSHVEARRVLLKVEAGIASAERRLVEPERLTVAELCQRFLASSHPRAKDAARYRQHAIYCLRPVLPLLGATSLDKLRRRDIESLRDRLGATYQPNTVRTFLGALSAVLSWGIKQEYLTVHPMQKLDLPKRQNSTDRLSAEQASQLLAVAKERALSCTGRRRPLHWSLYMVVALALRLGLRKGEALGLRWSDIDFTNARLTVARQLADCAAATAAGRWRTPKSGKSRSLPLPAALAEELRLWQAECPSTPAGLVCPLGSTAMGTLGELLEAAHCPRFARPLHSLRHSFASLVIEHGGSILAVKEALGHSSLEMTLVYSHISPSALAADLAKLKL